MARHKRERGIGMKNPVLAARMRMAALMAFPIGFPSKRVRLIVSGRKTKLTQRGEDLNKSKK